MGKIKGHVTSDEENQGSRPLPLVLEIQHRSNVKVFLHSRIRRNFKLYTVV